MVVFTKLTEIVKVFTLCNATSFILSQCHLVLCSAADNRCGDGDSHTAAMWSEGGEWLRCVQSRQYVITHPNTVTQARRSICYSSGAWLDHDCTINDFSSLLKWVGLSLHHSYQVILSSYRLYQCRGKFDCTEPPKIFGSDHQHVSYCNNHVTGLVGPGVCHDVIPDLQQHTL